jgi:diguanylate cyclase (GGDEF)-like protein/PAS domain S-box-containing protein
VNDALWMLLSLAQFYILYKPFSSLRRLIPHTVHLKKNAGEDIRSTDGSHSRVSKTKSYWSVRALLIYLVLACLLPGFIGACVFFVYEYQKSRAQLNKDTLQTARALVQTVDSHLLTAQAVALSLTTAESLLKKDFARFHDRAKKTVALSGLGTNVVLRDRAGRQILNTAVEYGQSLNAPLAPGQVSEVFATGKASYSNVFFGPVLRRLVVSVDVPVMIDNKIAYALGVGIFPEDINRLLRKQALPPGWVAAVVDKSGAIVGRTHRADAFIGQQTAPELVRALRSAREGAVALDTVEGIPVVSIYSQSTVTRWTVAIGIPRKALESEMIQGLSTLAIGVAVLFGIGLLLAWFVGGQIARSVKALIAPATALGSSTPVVFPRIHVREVAEVAQSISRAAELLQERAANLKTKEFELLEAQRLAKFGNWYWNLQTGEVQTSDSIVEIYGRDVPAFEDQKGTLLTLESWEKVNAAVKEAVQHGEGYDLELEVNHGAGYSIWINAKCKAIRNSEGQVIALRGAIQDITERKRSEQRIHDASLHDILTELPNRAFIFEYGSRLLAAARRGHGKGALLFIDLDRFKPINDLYGHEIGDRVLKEVSKRLIACTRQEDLVGRLGGDEFVILLPYIDTDQLRAAIIAQNVIDAIRRPFRIDHLELSLSVSIGISYFPLNATDVSTLIHTADLAMYKAKEAGRTNYQTYSPDLDQRANEVLAVEVRLKNALKYGGLELYYQPVIDIANGMLVGAEALARLNDHAGTDIGPAIFISIAESTGLIVELGEWVARQACQQQVMWRDMGLPINMAINVSPLQFRQQAFVEKLRAIILETNIDPAFLEIEVTESTLMESMEDAVAIIKRIKSLGVKVALDDFGTGYSSLSSLTTLPLDKLKVDQSFVLRVEHDVASRAVTEAVIALGRSLKLDVHGEGIETEGALHYLQKLGCNQAQGFLLSEALPATEFFHWAQKWAKGKWCVLNHAE